MDETTPQEPQQPVAASDDTEPTVDDTSAPMPTDEPAPTPARGRDYKKIGLVALAGAATVAAGFAIGTAVADGGHDHGHRGDADGRVFEQRDGEHDRDGDDAGVPRGMTAPRGGFQGGQGQMPGGMQGRGSTSSHGS